LENILPEVSAVCERIVIINKGEIAAIDTAENLSKGIGEASKLSVTVAGPKSSVTKLINELYGVKYVEAEIEKEKDTISYIIESDKEIDIRKPLFFALAKEGYPILELRSLNLSLEDIFIHLTRDEKGVVQ